jgi:hypothetical protein
LTGEWPLSEAQIVRHRISLLRVLYIRNTETEQDNCFPLPIRITPDDFRVSEQNQEHFSRSS